MFKTITFCTVSLGRTSTDGQDHKNLTCHSVSSSSRALKLCKGVGLTLPLVNKPPSNSKAAYDFGPIQNTLPHLQSTQVPVKTLDPHSKLGMLMRGPRKTASYVHDDAGWSATGHTADDDMCIPSTSPKLVNQSHHPLWHLGRCFHLAYELEG